MTQTDPSLNALSRLGLENLSSGLFIPLCELVGPVSRIQRLSFGEVTVVMAEGTGPQDPLAGGELKGRRGFEPLLSPSDWTHAPAPACHLWLPAASGKVKEPACGGSSSSGSGPACSQCILAQARDKQKRPAWMESPRVRRACPWAPQGPREAIPPAAASAGFREPIPVPLTKRRNVFTSGTEE